MTKMMTEALDLDGRVALVTGASRGIGAATAKVLAQANARVALLSRSRKDMETVAAGIPDENVLILPTDMKDDAAIDKSVKEVIGTWNHVDILVNNAGIVTPGNYKDISLDAWEEMLAVNLTAPFKLVTALVPAMEERGWGRIVNITSISAQTGGVQAGVHYSATKGGLEAMTRTLSRDLAASGVTVNNIAPGQIDTNPEFLTSEQRAMMNKVIPMGRLGNADDIAMGILYLVSSMGDYVTGATLDINGGLHKR